MLDDAFLPVGIRIPKTIEFFSDGTIQSDWGGSYTIDGNRLNISYSAMDSYSYVFSVNEDELTLQSTGDYASDTTEYRYLKNGAQADTANTLALTCDEIIAEGTNENGDTYQLVMNQAKSINGNPTYGIIKNNVWLMEMTETLPAGVTLTSHAFFVLNSCFCYDDFIWNVETNKVYILKDKQDPLLHYEDYSNGSRQIKSREITHEDFFLVRAHDIQEEQYVYDFVNAKTMQVEKSFRSKLELGPYSEGLIYGQNSINPSEKGFYDENGNQVLDLSKYYVANTPVFINGQCIIHTYSESGEVQYMTIDKDGNIISVNRP